MNLQQPARSTPSMGFGDKIDIWIEKQLRFSPVNGDEHSHLHFEGLRPGPEWDAGEVARKLLHHVGPVAHSCDPQ